MLTKADIEKYFLAEKQVGLILFIIGISAVVLAVICYFVLRTQFYRGAAIPLVLIGIMQCFIGFSHYRHSDESRIRNVYAFDMNPQELKQKELPALTKALSGIAAFKWGALVLAMVGVALVLVCRNQPNNAHWCGIGVALALQALIMFCTEIMAEKRVNAYRQQLETFRY